MKRCATISCLILCAVALANAEALLDNPDFLPGRDGESPEGWRFRAYGTDAYSLYDPEGGVDETGAVGVRSRDDDERGSWFQTLQLPGNGHLALTGWYRTEDISGDEAAMLRVTWRRDNADDLVISDERIALASVDEWTRFDLLLPAPAEAVAATIDLFNYYQPGVTWWSGVQARPPDTTGREAMEQWAEHAKLLEGEPAADGSNLLPNPSFELDVGTPGAPDFWEPGGTSNEGYPVSSAQAPAGSVEMRYETARGRSGDRSVAVECVTNAGRGAWTATVPLKPGPWVFEAWQTTRGMDPEPRQGPVARVSALDEQGRVILHFYGFGAASENDWAPVELRFDAPPGASSARIELRNAWAQGTVYWDDVYLGADVERRGQLEDERAEDQRLLSEARGELEQAREQVAALREEQTGAAGALLAAALDWALDDAALAIEAQLGRDAMTTLTDVTDYLARADAILSETELDGTDSEDDGNPYVDRLNRGMESLAENTAVYRKGEEGYREIEGSWTFRGVGQDAHVLAWALLDPRSNLQYEPRLLKRLLTHVQALADHHLGGSVTPHRDSRDWNIDRFALAPTLDALMQLEAAAPWLILPSKREAWRCAFREMIEYQYRTYGFRYYEHDPPDRPRLYPNMDVHYLLIMGIAHKMFDEERYAAEADRFVDLMDEGLFPMGAWTYSNMQNEVYVYHRHNTLLLARYYQITGCEHARGILDRSRPFYPLMHTPEGMVEHYTDVSWKHTCSPASPGGAEVKAGMFDCAENKRAALYASEWGGHESGVTAVRVVDWWKDIEPAEPEDDWLIFDENVKGPRGQYGRFSFAGTTRVAPGGGIGRDTFVGCMITDPEGGRRPLDAALQIATIQFQQELGGAHWSNARYHSGHEQHSVLVAPEFGSQAVRYRVTRPRWGAPSSDYPWEGVQQWFMSRNRLVGMLTLRPLEDTEAAGVWGRLNFGKDKDFESIADGEHNYGRLRVRIHEHNFDRIETPRAESDPGLSTRSRELLLKDAQSFADGADTHTYEAGTERFYVTEVFPDSSGPAEAVEAIREGSILGLAITEGAQQITVLHNQGDADATHRLEVNGETVQVHTPADEAGTAQPVDGVLEIEIPGRAHAVVVSAN